MNNKFITSLCLMLVVSYSSTTMSQTIPGWSISTKIESLRSHSGHIYASTSNLSSGISCPNGTTNVKTFTIAHSDVGFSEMFALLLTAEASERSVSVYRNGQCPGGNAKVTGVRMEPH